MFEAVTELTVQTVAIVAVQFTDVQKTVHKEFQSDPPQKSQKPHLNIT